MDKISYFGTQGCAGHYSLGINYRMTLEESVFFAKFDCDKFENVMRENPNKEHKCNYIQCSDYAVYGILYSVDDDRGCSHTYLFVEGKHTIEEIETIISDDAFLTKQFDVKNRFKNI